MINSMSMTQRPSKPEAVPEQLTPFLSRQQIGAAVKRLAGELDQDYQRRPPVLVGCLKGGFVFLADLVRQLKIPLRSIELMQVTSYAGATSSPGTARVIKGVPSGSITGQDVIVVEDIIDTGVTTATFLRYLRRHRPASLEVCALLDKPSRRRVEVSIRYVGITIPNRFVVGYGLDLDQRYRELPDIYTIAE